MPSSSGPQKHPPRLLSWAVWGLGAVFYLIGFYQRVAPAVMTRELMQSFAINAAALGNLSGLYFYSYVAMQVPTGILADIWGPRRLLTLGALTAAAGSVIFAVSSQLWLAGLGRILVGGSVAVAFVALLKVATHWFPPRQFALATGMALFCGVLGAVSAGTPLRLLVDAFTWRPVMLAGGFVTLGIALGIWVLVRDDPSQRGYRSHAPDGAGVGKTPWPGLAGIKEVFAQPNIWLLFLAGAGVVGPILAFAGLWGVPYLEKRYGLDQATGAAICSVLMVGWALGSPLLGGLSDRLGRRKPLYLGGALAGLVCWSLMLYVPGLPLSLFVALAAVCGLAGGGMILGFAFAKESLRPSLAGTVSGVVNMGVMLGPTILQPAMGLVLDLLWEGESLGGVRVYSLEAFQEAFLLIPACGALAAIVMAFSRETYCRQQQ